MVVIRKAEIADVQLLVNLARLTFEESFAQDNTPQNMESYLNEAFNDKKIESEIKEPGSQYFLAEIDRQVAGYARVRTSEEVKDKLQEPSRELHRIYVASGFQGLKIGASLMQACIDYVRSQGCKWLWLGVWENNIKAQRFYKAFGFEKFGEHIFLMGDDPQTDWLMKKEIS